MTLIRLLILNGLLCNRRVFVKYISTSRNILADSLSRNRLDIFGTTHQDIPRKLHTKSVKLCCPWRNTGNRFFYYFPDKKKQKYSWRLSNSSTISAHAMQNLIARLKLYRFRDSTRKNYYAIWRSFNKFVLRLDDHQDSWEERLVLFVGHLINENRQSATIKSYISAIKAILKADGITIKEDQYLLSSLTWACKLKNDIVHIRLPIQKDLLWLMIKTVRNRIYQDQPYLSRLYSAMLSTAYYGLFRVGEISSGSHPILVKDVHIAQNKNKMLFVLHTSKTHRKGNKPQLFKIIA